MYRRYIHKHTQHPHAAPTGYTHARDKVHSITLKEVTQAQVQISLLILLLRLYVGVGSENHAVAALPPGKRHGTHCTGGWVNVGAAWTRTDKSLSPLFEPRTVKRQPDAGTGYKQ